MKTRLFGTTGQSVSVLGQGSWYIDDADHHQAIKAFQAGLDAGMSHIDTAEMYGSGAAESVVGDAIRSRRDEVFLVSKVLPSNASYRGTIAACERSLKALDTDHLDSYLLHWRGSVPLEETFRAFEALQADGKILSYGVSNFDVDDLQEAWDILGPGKIACNQVLYHLQERAIEHAVIPWCQAHQVAVVAYSPFGHDDFPNDSDAGGQILQSIALAHQATPRQIALAFLTREDGLFTIPKSSSVAHTQANAAAAGITLSPTDIQRLDQAFPKGPQPSYLPMI
ncbi:aldo/keto reductase [Castellaniella sp.]|uniref:aldo/keto reductase n=1 Tax=Castellaniella sp. TaxID=1955812 RepID=UPI002AFFD011|nr:aldo/keto reductase [Castellaniella sp.]